MRFSISDEKGRHTGSGFILRIAKMVDLIDFLAAYSLLLIIVGTFGNLLNCLVCFRLRSNTTFVFLTFSAIFDAANLYIWNLSHFTQVFFGLNLQSKNLISCRIVEFFQFTTFEISAWLLVSESFHVFDCYIYWPFKYL